MEAEMDAHVLVVGAGPTGLMLANQLLRRGLRVTIIDRHAGPALQTRALGVQARTMEIYAKLGIVDRALELGKIAPGVVLWSQGRMTARVPIGETGKSLTPYPYVFILGQDDNELIMGEKLHELGGAVQWNTELVAIQQQPGQVTATLKQPDGTSREFTAAWVAGCDGAHSAVRELNGITFPGAPYEHVFFVADVVATGGMAAEEVNVYLWREGFHLFFPMRGPDHWRVVGILPEGLRDKPRVDFDAVIPSVRREAGEGLNFKACTWFSTYRIHHRSASHFRQGRCFLLGDAAHIHSPVGAQGMNTGLQDAYNLAWKLALVIQGRAEPALLDSYEAERIPVARRLLNTTDRLFKLIVSDNLLAGIFRTKILARVAAFAMNRPTVQNFAFRTVSQIGIHYRDSSLSETGENLPKDAPKAGDRFPWLRLRLRGDGAVEDLYQKLDDTHFHLIVIGQPAPSETALGMGDLLHVQTVHSNPVNHAALAQVGMPRTCFYLLRPDGHVGLCGVRLDAAEVKRYVAGRLHLIASPAQRAETVAQSGTPAE
jgi:2-polyprenyl-6-methoxyphenol hydroxylase-like FAD-dependent oxidoreductase